MTSLQGTLTVCGPSEGYSLSFTCTGPSCQALTDFPDTTCVDDGAGLVCTNNVICSGQTNYTSTFALTQPNVLVSQTQNIIINNWCDDITLTADGTTGGTNGTYVSTGPCGPPDAANPGSTTTSTMSSTTEATSSTLSTLSTTSSSTVTSETESTTTLTSTTSMASESTTSTTSTGSLESTSASDTTTSSSCTTTESSSAPSQTTSCTSTDSSSVTSQTSSSSGYSTSSGNTYPSSSSSAQSQYDGAHPTSTYDNNSPQGWQGWSEPTSKSNSGVYGSSEPASSGLYNTAPASEHLPPQATQSPTGNTVVQPCEDCTTESSSSSDYVIVDAPPAATTAPGNSFVETSAANGQPTAVPTSPASSAVPTSAGSPPVPQGTYTGSGSSFRRTSPLRLWTGVLLIFTLLFQGTLAMPNSYDLIPMFQPLVPRSAGCGLINCGPLPMITVVHNTTDLSLIESRKLTDNWQKFASLLAEYLAGKIDNGGEFADNLIAEVKNAVCEHASGALTDAVITKVLGVELLEECIVAVYAGNAIVAPELEFLSVLGASILCNLVVSKVTETAIPGLKELKDSITDICEGPKPCSDNLLTDPKNCGTCGNVCSSGVCANGACTANTCTGQTCDTFGPCGPGGSCVCASTSESTGFCVDGSTPCDGLAGCSTSLDCGSGQICAVNTCCERNVCVGASFCGASTTTTVDTTTTTTTSTTSTMTTTDETTTTDATTTTTDETTSTSETTTITSTSETTSESTTSEATTEPSATTTTEAASTTSAGPTVIPALTFHLQARNIVQQGAGDANTFQRSNNKYAKNAMDASEEYLYFSETSTASGTTYLLTPQNQLVNAGNNKVACISTGSTDTNIHWNPASAIPSGQAVIACTLGTGAELSCTHDSATQFRICSATTQTYGVFGLANPNDQDSSCRNLQVYAVAN